MKDLILRVNASDYFFPFLEEGEIQSVYKKLNVFERLLRFLLVQAGIPYSSAYGKWKRGIPHAGQVVLFDYGYSYTVTKYIKKHNPDCTIHLFIFNKMRDYLKKELKKDSCIDKIWTFDPQDAAEYGYQLQSSFYSRKVVLNKQPLKSDVVFLGKAKSRAQKVRKLEELLQKQGIRTDFMLVESDRDRVEYPEYLDHVAASQAILEVSDGEQAGFTLRVMEALFLEKKLVTNNKALREAPFYNEANIFILGEGDCALDGLKEFLKAPYQSVPRELVDYYDFDNWKKRFV